MEGQKQRNLTLEEAKEAILDGFWDVKLPNWEGFWFGMFGKIWVFTRDGKILDDPWFDEYKDRTDFEICNGEDIAIRILNK